MAAAKSSHSYSLRVRASSSNGAKDKTSSRQAESVPMPPIAANEISQSIAITYERRGSKNKNSTKSTAKSNVLTKAVTSSSTKGLSASRSSTASAKRSLTDVSDIEDFQPAAVYTFREEEAASIQSSLLSWYDGSHRVLPWRQNPHSRHQLPTADRGSSRCSEGNNDTDRPKELGSEQQQQRAYEVWVSEMMLQQTQVVTVISYYHSWMAKWPTLQDLAVASLEDVYRVWAGLGYYRRARFLLEGAKQIVDKYAGVFPESLTELRKVPGIGNYTAGAIASIAFNKPVPIVDGNIVRVLCRLRAISESPKASTTVKLLWALAEELVDAKRPGDLNQALMELGATLCTTHQPACPACPIASHCQALSLTSLEEGGPLSVKSVTEFPVKVAKVQAREEYISVCVLEVSSSAADGPTKPLLDLESHILVMQRPKKGLLAGLWEFPSVALGNVPVSPEKERAAMDCYLKESLGLDLGVSQELVKRRETLGTRRHLFSHIRWHMSVEWLLLVPSGLQRRIEEFRGGDADPIKWVAPDSVKQLGVTTSVRKIYEMYLKHLSTGREEESDGQRVTKKRTSLGKNSKNARKKRVKISQD